MVSVCEMFVLNIVVLFSVLSVALQEEKKWVWEDSNKKAKYSKSRYDVIEEEEDYAPGGSYLDNVNEPFINRPLFAPAPPRPGGVYGNGANVAGGYGNGGQYPAILTGPVPSWAQEQPIKDFDRCKCAEKFNCNSPGISYGHCDVGKQYCCYVSKPHNAIGGPIPSRPVHSPENGILVGPGGPVDYPNPARPPVHHQRPLGGFGVNANGVLAGPGNAGGHYGRPQRPGGRPGYYADNGILIGPGGPFDRPYRPSGGGYSAYARTAKKEEE